MQEAVEQPLAALVERLRKAFPTLVSIYHFSSCGAAEYERPESDLDLAVYAGTALPCLAVLRCVVQELASEIGRDVDLVDLARASTAMRVQVIHNGRRIYCTDRVSCETFEDYTYSSYARLNEERQDILEDIRRQGSLYDCRSGSEQGRRHEALFEAYC